MRDRLICSRYLVFVGLAIAILTLNGCDNGGSSSEQTNPAPAQDFSISLDESTVYLVPNDSTTLTISITGVNGFNWPVSVSVTDLTSSITVSPSSFTLAAGNSKKIRLTASANVAIGTTKITISGTANSLSHSAVCNLKIITPAKGTYAPLRVRYLDLAQHVPFDVGQFPTNHLLYHSPTRRFFSADPYQNSVFAFDAASELQVGQITVPGAWMIDESLDENSLYVGTEVGDIYQIDPVSMTVIQSIQSRQIGPTGYPTYEVHPLADGRFALLGNENVDPLTGHTYGSFAIWNQTDNSLIKYATHSNPDPLGITTPPVCGSLANIAFLSITPDRTKLMLGSADTDQTICQFDPATAQSITAAIEGRSLLQPPDGKEFLITGDYTNVFVYDASTLQLIDQFPPADIPGGPPPQYILSPDGNTLYGLSYGVAVAYNWRTHTQLGWTSSPRANAYFFDLVPLAVDQTGLIAGSVGHGIGFADGAALQSNVESALNGYPVASVSPNVGTLEGGTQVEVDGGTTMTKVKKVFFGHQPGTDLSGPVPLTATSPAHTPGPVDVTVQSTNGYVSSAYLGFSYGPSISAVRTPFSTAEGGSTETIFGYGLIPYRNRTPYPDSVQITVAGRPAPILNYSPFQYSDLPGAWTSLQAVQVVLPPGTPGASVDVTISNADGAVTAQNAIKYLPPTEQFPLPGAQLAQGVYDPKRDVYYFTDVSKVQVFSRTQGKWLSPIAVPQAADPSKQSLCGISLSPDASRLAVSDPFVGAIYLINPDLPTSLQTFSVPNPYMSWPVQPCGLAISDFGMVYFASFNGGDGGPSLFKLDTSTGTVTSYGFQTLAGGDAYQRVLLSSDNKRIFYALPPGVNRISQITGTVYTIDTGTDAVQYNPIAQVEDYELALSPDQTSLSAGEALLDTNLNLRAYLAANEVQLFDELFVYGEKLSSDGRLLFEPLVNGIVIADARTGLQLNRIGLPVSLCPTYDALVSNGRDNVLVAIAGTTGDGVIVVDLSSVTEPLERSQAAIRSGRAVPPNPALIAGIRPSRAESKPSSAQLKIRAFKRRYKVRTPASRAVRPIPSQTAPQRPRPERQTSFTPQSE